MTRPIIKNKPWDERFMDLAWLVSSWSKDPSTRVGAVVVHPNKRLLAIGYNGFPPGLTDYEDRYLNREIKYVYVQHAERNALDNASFDTIGSTLYCTFAPCHDCAKSIITKGITRVVTYCPERPYQHTALEMFEEAGVSLEIHNE